LECELTLLLDELSIS